MFDILTEILIVAGLVSAWLIAWAWKIWGPAPPAPLPRGALRRAATPGALRGAGRAAASPSAEAARAAEGLSLRAGSRKARTPARALTAAGQAQPVFRMMRRRPGADAD
ncbi:MAG: hypothetical protein VYD87_14920 [Pseudomonadota bacterium]|nr:hypothetical protein [Pseudomonadota bacterium]